MFSRGGRGGRVEKRLVEPFYLGMMGLNALRNADECWAGLVRAGRNTNLAEVQTLLAPDHWRPVVMGAWFSLRFNAAQVGDDLIGALSRCRGTLTAPPLAVAASLVLGRDSGPPLIEYIERDISQQYGAAGFVSAAHERICGTATVEVTDGDRQDLKDMLNLAEKMRTALTAE